MIERSAVDVDLAGRQWRGYFEALVSNGWTVETVVSAPGCADSVFIEDTAVVFGDTAVIARPGALERRPEVEAVAAHLGGVGLDLQHIEAPGTLDGGDVLKVGSTVWVGYGHRTNEAAIEQLRVILEPRGWTVIGVPNRAALHLKSAVTALPDGTIIGWERSLDDPTAFAQFLAMPEEAGAHVVDLGGGRVLMSASAPRSIDLIASLGWSPVAVGISEFEKLEGCVTCLSIRMRSHP